MQALQLTLRGLRWRAGSSLAVLVVAVVAAGAAALGPLYASSAEESLVRDSLAMAEPVTTGVQFRGGVAGQTQFTPQQVSDAVAARAADPTLDPWYGPATSALTVANGSPRIGQRVLGVATVSWYEGQCGGVTITDGRCPGAAGEAMISSRLSADLDIPPGTELRLGITSDSEVDRVVVVGTYDVTTADPAVWGLATPSQFAPAPVEGPPDRLDEILVGEQTLLSSTGDLSAVGFRTLDAATVRVDELSTLADAVSSATATVTEATGVRTTAASNLPDYLDSLVPQRDAVGATSLAVTAQLVLLAWFVLFLVIAGTSEERAGEVALAKLRGMSPGSTVGFGLGEPVLLLAFSLPLGLAAAWATTTALASAVLLPGTSVALTPAVALALTLCFAGGVSAALLASRRILTAPVLDQLRRTGGRKARLVRSVAVDAAAVALAVAAVYELRTGDVDSLALLAPGLLSLAAGLLAVRVIPVLARVGVARTRARGPVASFLATRNVARRPGGLRIVVLLTVAVGLAVFAVDGWVVAAAARGDLARAQVGGWTVLHVRAPSPGALLDAVRAVDPEGRRALAAAVADVGDGGLGFVDARRLAAVSAWDPAWAGVARDDVGSLLHPLWVSEPIPVRDRLSWSGDLRAAEGAARITIGLQLVVRAPSGVPYRVDLGPLRAGRATYAADLPPCRAQPCSIVSIAVRQPIGIPGSSFAGQLVLSDAIDGDGSVDLAPAGAAGWRTGSTGLPYPADPDAVLVRSAAEGDLSLDLDLGPIQDGALEVADHPAELPVLRGSENAARAEALGSSDITTGLDGAFLPAATVGSGVVARLLRTGTLADLPYAVASTSTPPVALDLQVWLGPEADDEIAAELQAAGVQVTGRESVTEQEEALGRSGEALALRVFLIAAIAALLLGAGTLLAQSYVVLRRRAYELAALSTLGASRRSLVASARREQLALATAGVALGATAGLVSAGLALGPLLSGPDSAGPTVWLGPAWSAVIALLAVVVLALAVVADVGARRTVDSAVPDLLRQVQE